MHPEGIPHHLGINYIVSSLPKIDKTHYLNFQRSLVDEGIDFDSSGDKPEIHVLRKSPPLKVQIFNLREAPVGQLLIVAPLPNRLPDEFGKEAEAIVRAFNKTWEQSNQILACDSTIRYLYETSSEHAFQELWETRLGQSEKSLAVLGRNVLGGGIRFVMPPMPGEGDPTEVEVKIESFLHDTKKIFVEVVFKWLQPKPPGSLFDPIGRLKIVDAYIENEVRNFITEGHDDTRP